MKLHVPAASMPDVWLAPPSHCAGSLPELGISSHVDLCLSQARSQSAAEGAISAPATSFFAGEKIATRSIPPDLRLNFFVTWSPFVTLDSRTAFALIQLLSQKV